jgi:hypothetical protein
MMASTAMKLAAGNNIGPFEDPPEKALAVIGFVLADGEREHEGKE